jgi:arylsulfatase A-like enzyme/HEAT repeat protein
VGCAGGALGALADFGAHWLWLDQWRDRGVLLLRLLGLLVPAGAALGASFGFAIGASDGWLQASATRLAARTGIARERLLLAARALRMTLLLAPGLIAVAVLLWSGGTMARVPGKPVWQLLTGGLLLAGAFAVARGLHAIDGWAHGRPAALRALGCAALALGFALAKINQWVLPKLYDYLHGALTAGAFALFAVGVYWCAASLASRSPARVLQGLFVPALGLAGGALALTMAQLEHNQNVRVALLHPHAAHSRSVMQAVAPYLIEPAQRRAMEQARLRARQARARRIQHPRAVVGPVHEDAHVLLVTIDALRADHLGNYGYRRDTSPNLDRLAAQSVVFERAYAPAPHSSYSLCSMMTSEYLHETLDLGRPPPLSTLPSVLAQAGYHTAAFYTDGIFHTAAERLEAYEHGAFGFALHDQSTYVAEQLTERALAEVERTVARGEPSSLFWVHYFDVHEPYRSTHFGSSDLDRYDSEIRHVDAEVQRLIEGVRQRLARDVIVVLSADHGEEFHDHGGVYHGSTVYDEQVRVPLIINAPGLHARRVPAPVSTIDIAPTVLGFLGLSPAATMRGRDLRPLATGAGEPPQPAFSAVIHKKMIVQWPYKLIADLRFGLFELYHLERDPGERDNLADRQPERVAALRLEVYGWLDSLGPRGDVQGGPVELALDWGRLGDRRAVEPLSRLVADRAANAGQRIDAARMLGHLADRRAAASLLAASEDERAPRVAAEAAIALGRMYDSRARRVLRRLVRAEDSEIRVRAAVSLGRLRDPEAVPALIDTLWIDGPEYERHEAIRWLGRLRDRRALEPLIDLLPELRTRFLVVVAIGEIGDRRAYERLAHVLTWDRHANVRDATVQALGLLGDPHAIDLIAPLAAEDASLKLATESLVRLSAIARGAIGGADVTQQDGLSWGLGDCYEGPLVHDWDYLHRTFCLTRASAVNIPLQVPRTVSDAEFGAVAVLSAKRTDQPGPAELTLEIDGRKLAPLKVDGGWSELRWTLPEGSLRTGRAQARIEALDPDARFAIDHLLLLPRSSLIVAQHSP